MGCKEREIADKIILKHMKTQDKNGVHFGWSDSYSLEKLNGYLKLYNLKAWVPNLMEYDSELFWSVIKKE